MAIVVVGLGKLGAPFAASMAGAGHQVTGVDWDEHAVKQLAKGMPLVPEPGLEDLLRSASDKLAVTTDLRTAVQGADATFVIVPTPSTPSGAFSTDNVLVAIGAIGEALQGGSEWHLVTVVSTVNPGDTGGAIRQELERSSGRTVGVDLGLCFHPEFIALGSVLRDLARPDFLLIGEHDERSGSYLHELLVTMVGPGVPVVRLKLVEAELAKLAVNTFVTTKISYANMLAEFCDHLDGADAVEVCRAIGLDRRIGQAYLKPGHAYGGPCLSRDNAALAAFARSIECSADIAIATDQVNQRQTQRLVDLVGSAAAAEPVVAIVGLAYKPGTPVIEASAGFLLAKALAARNRVVVYDPLVTAHHVAIAGRDVSFAGSLAEALERADLVYVMHPNMAGLNLALDQAGHKLVVIDCWGTVSTSGQHTVVRPGCTT